ncbi:ABC transporter ATP-binding protein [Bdellovibrio bacteriovorus]|uniref:ABC transporter ATP-binding protein n=1 Tax=Bdellovibrio bacteriovorus TaxID=959 RepID=UPI003AA94EA8
MEENLNIELKNIRVSLPNGRLLFSVRQFDIPHGHHLLLQGESGAGKTTLLHLIAGLFTPQEGEVFVGPHRVSHLDDDSLCDLRRDKIGVIFQKLNLLDHLTCEENVLLVSESAKESLQKVRLGEKAQDRVSYLSLGEQQRVAVARVLAQKPEIILADEPTSSLDETNMEFVMQALKEAAAGKTLIVVSHDHRITKYFDQVMSFKELTA